MEGFLNGGPSTENCLLFVVVVVCSFRSNVTLEKHENSCPVHTCLLFFSCDNGHDWLRSFCQRTHCQTIMIVVLNPVWSKNNNTKGTAVSGNRRHSVNFYCLRVKTCRIVLCIQLAAVVQTFFMSWTPKRYQTTDPI